MFGFGDLKVAEAAFHHGGWAGKTMLFDEVLFEAAGIHADPHGQSAVFCLAHHLTELVEPAKIAGIDPNFVDRVVHGRQSHPHIKVNITYQGDMNA